MRRMVTPFFIHPLLFLVKKGKWYLVFYASGGGSITCLNSLQLYLLISEWIMNQQNLHITFFFIVI